MGTYVYRVTAKQVTCSDGKKANIAIFAYKPYGGWSTEDEKINNKMHFKSGATSSDRMAANNRITDRIVHGDKEGKVHPDSLVYHNVNNYGTFYDNIIGGSYMPKIDGVTV
jgi:hypothetical protein